MESEEGAKIKHVSRGNNSEKKDHIIVQSDSSGCDYGTTEEVRVRRTEQRKRNDRIVFVEYSDFNYSTEDVAQAELTESVNTYEGMAQPDNGTKEESKFESTEPSEMNDGNDQVEYSDIKCDTNEEEGAELTAEEEKEVRIAQRVNEYLTYLREGDGVKSEGNEKQDDRKVDEKDNENDDEKDDEEDDQQYDGYDNEEEELDLPVVLNVEEEGVSEEERDLESPTPYVGKALGLPNIDKIEQILGYGRKRCPKIEGYLLPSELHSEFSALNVEMIECLRYLYKMWLRAKQHDLQVSKKSSPRDLVTEMDKWADIMLRKYLGEILWMQQFICEESQDGKIDFTDESTFIIDPIDGTMNMVHSFPFFCCSIAMYSKKLPEMGYVFDLTNNVLYSAFMGFGSYKGTEAAHVSGCKQLKEALVLIELGTSVDREKHKNSVANFNILAQRARGIRSVGSCAMSMALVASGAADAYFEFGIHLWDFAAGALLVTEAGGVVIDPAGGPLDYLSRRVLCASSQELADELTSCIKQYYPERD